jgi:hypothetical protein
MELCLNPHLIKKWKKLTKREAKGAKKGGEAFDPTNVLEVKFLRNLIEELFEVICPISLKLSTGFQFSFLLKFNECDFRTLHWDFSSLDLFVQIFSASYII